ncbi:unnamed protein product, partial [Vitis vinifera]
MPKLKIRGRKRIPTLHFLFPPSCFHQKHNSEIERNSRTTPWVFLALQAIFNCSSTKARIELSCRSFKTLLSDAILIYSSVVLSILSAICPFSFCSCAALLNRSSKCCCFLIRDRFADSRFDCILFLFLSSITAIFGSPQLGAEPNCYLKFPINNFFSVAKCVCHLHKIHLKF